MKVWIVREDRAYDGSTNIAAFDNEEASYQYWIARCNARAPGEGSHYTFDVEEMELHSDAKQAPGFPAPHYTVSRPAGWTDRY